MWLKKRKNRQAIRIGCEATAKAAMAAASDPNVATDEFFKGWQMRKKYEKSTKN